MAATRTVSNPAIAAGKLTGYMGLCNQFDRACKAAAATQAVAAPCVTCMKEARHITALLVFPDKIRYCGSFTIVEEMSEPNHEAGLLRLRHPVRPLLFIVEFIFHTGAFSSVEEVLTLLPNTIETDSATYSKVQRYLQPYLPELEQLTAQKTAENTPYPKIFAANGETLDRAAACSALLTQQILEKELEQINSLLCGTHHCTLCCTGPDADMRQHYFEIPLKLQEEALFSAPALGKIRREGCGQVPLETIANSLDDSCREAVLINHQQGTSLILPRHSNCPALDTTGRCRIYGKRPFVCRKPQIFPYLLEEEPQTTENDGPSFRLRNTLLAVMDCPYVQQLQDEIALYAAASELELVFRRNKA